MERSVIRDSVGEDTPWIALRSMRATRTLRNVGLFGLAWPKLAAGSPPAPFGLRRGILLSLSRAKDGGRDRDRTCDPYHVKVVLSR